MSNERGYRLVIEAEDYAASYDLGGETIRRKEEAGCGGGHLLAGLDTTGEWVQYEVTIAQEGLFRIGLICAGEYNVSYGMRLVLTDITPTEAATWGAIKSLYE